MWGKFVRIFLGCLLTSIVQAQINPGARQIALSNSDVAQGDDVFSLFNNPAGLAQLGWREIGLYYSPAPFGLKELANGYLSYIEPTDFGSLSIGAMTYGFELYKENCISLGYSKRFEEKYFAGITIDFHTLSIQNYGSDNTFTINLGGLAYLTENIKWGFSFHNITRATFGKEKNQIPIIFNTGFSFNPVENAALNAAVEKDIEYPLSIRFGLEFFPIKYLYLRTGFSNEPERYSAGIGINYSIIELDYAVFTHQDLGLTHQAGIIINFSGDEPRINKIKRYLGFE
jgi:hypothetical protein